MAKKNNIVTLRGRELSNGDTSLFLDYYVKGKRKQEFLGLYLKPETDRASKEANRKTRIIADAVRAQRIVEVTAIKTGTATPEREPAKTIVKAFEEEERRQVGRTTNTWVSAERVLREYCATAGDLPIDKIDAQWAEGFMTFVRSAHRSRGEGTISATTAEIYTHKVRAVFNRAVRLGVIPRSPFAGIRVSKVTPPERSYLTKEEVMAMAATEVSPAWLRRAFFFSCLTGLRASDIIALKWGQIRRENGRTRIIFSQKKTGGQMYLDISDAASRMLGERPEDAKDDDRAVEMTYSNFMSARLANWALRAGVTKHVTFHTARHTFATLALTEGVDLFTVSKLLGHSSVKTTQIYAKIIDEKMQKAVDSLPDLDL